LAEMLDGIEHAQTVADAGDTEFLECKLVKLK
jgi:hypothetical protein